MVLLQTKFLEQPINSIPKQSNKPKRKTDYFWDKKCSEAKKNKNKALAKYKRNYGNIDYFIEYKKATAKYRFTIKNARIESWNKFVNGINNNTNSSDVWKKVRILTKGPTSKPILLKINNTNVTDPNEIANSFAIHFSNKSNGKYDNKSFMQHKAKMEKIIINFEKSTNESYNKPITKHELSSVLTTCNSNTPGPDGIPYSFIKILNDSNLSKIISFYNYLFNNGFPHQWREASVIPIPKPNKPKFEISSYRPIALTNCLCKILEKILNKRLQTFLEEQQFYTNSQSAYRKSHSTLDPLCRLEHQVRTSLTMGDYCVGIFIDIDKAFDTVWHQGLMLKLKEIGLKGLLPKFIQSFLACRKISVNISNNTSPLYPLHCGVPQGSVLSPTLFSIMINDLFQNIPNKIQTSLFADDGAIWYSHNSIQSALTTLQLALNQIHVWCNHWGLKVSETKTKAIIFTNKRKFNPTPLHINNKVVPFVTSMKFLGLIFDQKLTWKYHIMNLKDRCQKDLQLMRIISSKNFGANYNNLRTIYIGLIRSKLDYGSFIYGTAAKTHLTQIDRIQYQASRIMLGTLRCTPNLKIEAEANIMPLKHRRNLLLMKYTSKIISIPNHPVREILLKHTPISLILNKELQNSSIDQIYYEFDKNKIDITKIQTIDMHHRYTVQEPLSKCSIAHCNKSNRSSSQWQELFHSLIDSHYSSHQLVFTDGSVQGGRAGCAVWSSKFSFACRLPDDTSIFSAELFAIHIALVSIASRSGNFVIFTDSLSVNRAICNQNNTHYLLTKIRSALSNHSSSEIIVEWIPSHMGIHGNEKADNIAKESLKLPNVSCDLSPSIYELHRQVEDFYNNDWQLEWNKLNKQFTNFKPKLGPTAFTECDRIDQTSLTRLRLQTTLLTHQHYFSSECEIMCDQCQEKMSLPHLIIQCPLFEELRQPLRKASHDLKIPFTFTNLIQPSFPPQKLIQFIRNTPFKNLI